MNIDLMSISGHKCYGPKGVGALYIRRKPRVRLEPLMSGGGQERGYRSGTLPTPLVVVGARSVCDVGPGQGGGAVQGGNGGRSEADQAHGGRVHRSDPARSGAEGTERGVASGCDAERGSRASVAGQREFVVLVRGGRVADYGHAEYRGVHGVGVHERVVGAVVCDEGAGRAG